MGEFNQTNNTIMNISMTTTADQAVKVDLRLPGNIVIALTFVCVAAALTLNALVLIAISKTDEEKLKMKFLLKNAIAGDMMLAVFFALRIIMTQTAVVKNNLSIVSLCATVVHDFYTYFALFYQIYASMAVAIDRFYSILQPLSYHAMKYDTKRKAIAFLLIFASTLGLSLPVIITKLKPGDSLLMICFRAFERPPYARFILPYVITCSVLFTMGTYCTIFALIVFYRRTKRDSLGQTNENQAARKSQTSLALTFFLIHITYILMYLPGTLYHSALSEHIEDEPYLDFYLGELFVIIYLANTIVDPIIYMLRIRSIRENMQTLCCSRKKGKAQKLGRDKPNCKPEPTMTSTVKNLFSIVSSGNY